jgi:diacylglycerol kinase (ATP)
MLTVDQHKDTQERYENSAGRAILIVNAKAREGHNRYRETLDALLNAGIEIVEAHPVKKPRYTHDLIERAIAREKIDTVIAGGGDGTLSLVADIAARHDLQMGIIPLGTANDFARNFNIPKNIEQAVNIIKQCSLLPVDLGLANQRHFLNVASLGLGVEVAQRMDSDLKKKIGSLAYGVAAVQAIRAMRPLRIRLNLPDEGEREFKALHITVANGRFYGGGMVSAPNADLQSGRLHVSIIENLGVWEMVEMLPGLRDGSYINHPKVRHFTTSSLTIETHKPRYVNLDGEIAARTPVTFKVSPNALKVFAPAF